MKQWLIVREPYDRDAFTPGELETAHAFRLAKRREEWLLARFAAKRLAVQLGITDDPRLCTVARPMLMIDGSPVDWFVSISHSPPYAAAMVGREPVGIDIQVVRPLPEAAAHLFLTDPEIEMVRRCVSRDALLHFWCAKEALWKQRSGDFATLRQVPFQLAEETSEGLVFDSVRTQAIEDVIVAFTL